MRLLELEKINNIENKINCYKDKSIDDVDINDIDNMDDLIVNEQLPPEERILEFLNTVRNPYFFNVNGFKVKISFSDSTLTADECIENTIKNLVCK